MKILAASSALSLLFLVACSNRVISDPPVDAPPVSVCEIDAECDPGEFCEAGVCALVEVAEGDCASRADCPAGQVCLDGDCGAPPAPHPRAPAPPYGKRARRSAAYPSMAVSTTTAWLRAA